MTPQRECSVSEIRGTGFSLPEEPKLEGPFGVSSRVGHVRESLEELDVGPQELGVYTNGDWYLCPAKRNLNWVGGVSGH